MIESLQQLDFPTGAKLRDDGCHQVLSHNEEYREQFYITALQILEQNGSVTSDEVVAVIGLPQGHRNAVGAAMRAFVKACKLERTGFVPSSRVSRHAGLNFHWGRR